MSLIEDLRQRVRLLQQQIAEKMSSNKQWESYYGQQEILRQRLEKDIAARAPAPAPAPAAPDYTDEEKMIEQYKTSIADTEEKRNEAIALNEKLKQSLAQLQEAMQQSQSRRPAAAAAAPASSRTGSMSLTIAELAEQLDVVRAQGLLYLEDLQREREDRLKAEQRLKDLLNERQAFILQLKEYSEASQHQHQHQHQLQQQQVPRSQHHPSTGVHRPPHHTHHHQMYRRRGAGSSDIECDGPGRPQDSSPDESFSFIDASQSASLPHPAGHSLDNAISNRGVNQQHARHHSMDAGLDVARDYEILYPADVRHSGFDRHDGGRVQESNRHDDEEDDSGDVVDGGGAAPRGADWLKCPQCDKRFALDRHLDLLDHFDSHS